MDDTDFKAEQWGKKQGDSNKNSIIISVIK
jgi:hypothetical protein